MFEAVLAHLPAFLSGIVGGLVASYGMRWGISRRCYRLEVSLADLQRVILSLKGAAGAEKRWKTRDLLDEQMLSLNKGGPSSERFANDPLPYG